ncbi:MAG: urate oxidase [Candidatus Acidiferrum sp.]
MAALAENRYGKSRVRLVRVNRKSIVHDFQEWTVEVLLQGDFLTCFTDGDNNKILPTDTMKNIVYFLARKSSAACIEDFAKELVGFLLSNNPQVSAAEVTIREKYWQHLVTQGKEQPSTFTQAGSELQTAHVSQYQGRNFEVSSGVSDLIIMKTSNSGFEGYIKDQLTTLPETNDRLFGTNLRATWVYSSPDTSYSVARKAIREALLSTFAVHDSKSVQHTLYAMAEAALDAAAQISEIMLRMPNVHCLLADLSRFGLDNPNHIFVPIDEPHGTIEARIVRKS